jgi:hypothetical protein
MQRQCDRVRQRRTYRQREGQSETRRDIKKRDRKREIRERERTTITVGITPELGLIWNASEAAAEEKALEVADNAEVEEAVA